MNKQNVAYTYNRIFHSYKKSRVVKFLKTHSRTEAARGLEGSGDGASTAY